jgi:Fe-Mn family superoxide dismutase
MERIAIRRGNTMKEGIIVIALCIALICIAAATPVPAQGQASGDLYKAKDYSSLSGMKGFSDTLLKNHFTLYQGYVKNANAVLAKLQRLLADGNQGSLEYSELKRRLGWEINGVLLHELYFENMGGSGKLSQDSALYKKIVKDFGSYESWKKDFTATAKMRGIGWVVLYHEPVSDRLVNMWIDEHALNHPSGARPLLVIDVFEHAFLTDFGLNRPQYIDTFFNVINWDVAAKRLK